MLQCVKFSFLFSCVLLMQLVAISVAEEKINVIIIYADDLGNGDLSCYGHPEFKTPHLDQMAAQGVRFTQFYSSCAYCAPSRASLMTGRYPFRNNMMLSNPLPKEDFAVRDRKEPHPNDKLGIPSDEQTLGEKFQQAGYDTICIGKWHLGHYPQYYPTRNGFDQYLGILYSNDMHPVELWKNEKVIEYPVVQATITKRYTERALQFIDEKQDAPFFLYLPHAMPHKPLACSEEFYGKVNRGNSSGLYGDVISELDWSIGQVLKKLRDLHLEKKTLVLFTSDNGPWFGGSTGGLRGMKSKWWDGGLRVPMIAWWPDTIPANQTIEEPAIIMDLFATALSAANVSLPDDRVIDGVNLLPAMTGQKKLSDRPLFSYQGQVNTVRLGKWKLHRKVPTDRMMPDDWVDPRAPDGVTLLAPFEQPRPSEYPGLKTGDSPKGIALFNLETDPAEQKDVAKEHPEVVKQLQTLLEKMQENQGKSIGQGK